MMPIGAPPHRALMAILKELYSEQECRVACVMPLRPTPASTVAKQAGLSLKDTELLLDVMAGKGLVADIPRESGPTMFFLNPTIIGFFEYTMMRVRSDIDQKKVAELMWEYLRDDPELAFMRMLTNGETFIARPLVNEQALAPEISTEVLDWEKASFIITTAQSIAETICHCRHVKLHLDKRCSKPLRYCLTLNRGADYLSRNGLAEPISRSRALEILEDARANAMVQMADNVRNRPAFICNCCKCCCEMMEAFRTLPDSANVVTSNFVARPDSTTCVGCGTCVAACPIDAIELVPRPGTAAPGSERGRRRRASVDEARCLGCGVCSTVCSSRAMDMRSTPQRTIAPESSLARMMLQAIERGRLQHLLFGDQTRMTHRTMASVCKVLLALPPAKQLLARRQLRSRFVSWMIEQRMGRSSQKSTTKELTR